MKRRMTPRTERKRRAMRRARLWLLWAMAVVGLCTVAHAQLSRLSLNEPVTMPADL